MSQLDSLWLILQIFSFNSVYLVVIDCMLANIVRRLALCECIVYNAINSALYSYALLS